MYLDAVNKISVEANISDRVNALRVTDEDKVYARWEDWYPSQISHHGTICCEIGREWITATDFSQLNGDSVFTGPRWLRERFNWGASSFPIYWCEAVRKKTLDCGALAALGQEVFTARGVKNYRVQLVQKFSEVATHQWTESWNNSSEPLKWVDRDLIYHEGCAIDLGEHRIKVWDASAGWWIEPKSSNGYGSLLAIRVSAFNPMSEICFSWGEYSIKSGEWMILESC
jgi:hypothetical protein